MLFDLQNIDMISTDDVHTILRHGTEHIVFDKIHSTNDPRTFVRYHTNIVEKINDITKLSICTAITFECDIDPTTVCNLLTSYKHLTKLHAVMLPPSRGLIDALSMSPRVVSLSICIGENTNISLFNELIATVPLNELSIRVQHDINSEYVVGGEIIQTLSNAPIKHMNFTTNREFSTDDINKIIKIISTNSQLNSVNIDKKINGWLHEQRYLAIINSLINAVVSSGLKRFKMAGYVTEELVILVLRSKNLTEFTCESYWHNAQIVDNELEAIMNTNYTLTTCKLNSRDLFSTQLARNRLISRPSVHKTIVDICIALLPHFDNIYCILWIFDYIDPNYYYHTDSKFKISVIMNVKKSIDEIKNQCSDI